MDLLSFCIYYEHPNNLGVWTFVRKARINSFISFYLMFKCFAHVSPEAYVYGQVER